MLNHSKLEITGRNFYSEEEAIDMVKVELNIIGDNLITARVLMTGYANIVPGHHIKIEGLGKQLDGKYYVTDVTHTIDVNGFSTRFNVSKNNIISDIMRINYSFF